MELVSFDIDRMQLKTDLTKFNVIYLFKVGF